MVLLHGHLQVTIYEAHDIGRAYYSKKSIFKSFFKGCAQNAKQMVEKHKHADRDCYVAVYAGTKMAMSPVFSCPELPTVAQSSCAHLTCNAECAPCSMHCLDPHANRPAQHTQRWFLVTCCITACMFCMQAFTLWCISASIISYTASTLLSTQMQPSCDAICVLPGCSFHQAVRDSYYPPHGRPSLERGAYCGCGP